jgi:hypothetical protein
VDAVRRIAETVLYEGHLLWPYRRSAAKNRERWTFGRLAPRGSGADGEARALQLQALLEAEAGARLTVTARFLQLVERRLERDGEIHDALEIAGRTYTSWDEAAEREVRIPDLVLGARPRHKSLRLLAGRREEPIEGDGGVPVTLVRTWDDLWVALEVATEAVAPGLWRITVHVENRTRWGPSAGRRLAATLLSTHVIAHVPAGRFVSAQDPPPVLRDEVAACRNVGTWPVLAGEPGDRATLLGAPIVLYDHPQIAPESPGDFCDATEIDQMLVLNVLALTDAERQEMAASDPRGRAILDRCSALTVDDFMRLHGAIRDPRPAGEE